MELDTNNKVLVVEDEPVILDLIRDTLEYNGYTTDGAADGEEAIQRLKENQYDLVITDWTMPRKGGLDVLIYAKEHWEDIIVIVLTGQASIETAVQSLQKGANDFLLKPFNISELINTIKVHLRRQYLQRENKRLQQQTEIDRDQLRKKVAELNILRQLSVNLSYEFDFSQIFSLIHDSLSQAMYFDMCASLDLTKYEIIINSTYPLEEYVLKWVEESLVNALSNKYDARIHSEQFKVQAAYYEEKPLISEIPAVHDTIIVEGKTGIYGCLLVARISPIPFTSEDSDFLRDLATQLSNVFNRLKGVIESQRSKLHFIVDNLPDGVFVFEQQDDMVILNPMARQMIDRRSSREVTKKDIENRLNIVLHDIALEIKREGKPVIKQVTLDNGKDKMILDAHVGHLPNQDGLPSGLIMVLRDVTRERTLEQMKREFISNVHHELRTPAAIIKEFTSLLHDQIGGPINERQMEYVKTMQRNMDRLLRLIENLLLSSRMEVNKIELKRKKTDIVPLIQIIAKEYLVRCAQKKMYLKEEIPEQIIEMDVDTDAIIQIFANFLDNAIKFSPQGSTITISVEDQGDEVLFSVADEGKGIAPEHLNHVFDRFYRIESTEEARREGAGLGLPIIKELVAKHEGTVWVESRINEGSTFFVKMPKSK